MNQQNQEPNQLIETLDVLGYLLAGSRDSDSGIDSTEHPTLNAYLDSVNRAMEKFQHRATELSNSCVENEVAVKQGLGRITVSLFSLGIAMSVIMNMLLITIDASLTQLALCNFGTMIIFVLAGLCLLNDITRRDRSDGTQPIDIQYRIQSISENVDQLSRLTFDWNKQLQELSQKKLQADLSIQSLESQEQDLANRVVVKENELQQMQNDCQIQHNATLGLKTEYVNLQSQLLTLREEVEVTLGEKANVEQEFDWLKKAVSKAQSELATCESSISTKQQEIDEIEVYSQQVQSEIMGIQKRIIELEVISEGVDEGINEKNRVLEKTQNEIDSLIKNERSLTEAISEVECRLEVLCTCETRHRDLNGIQIAFEGTQQKIDVSMKELEKLQHLRIDFENTIVDLESKESTLATGLELLRMEFQEQSLLVDRKAECLDSLADEEMKVQQQIVESNIRLAALQSQEIEQAELLECESLLAMKREEMCVLQSQTESLRDEVYVLAREASELQGQISALEEELKASREEERLSHQQDIDEKILSIELLDARVISTRESLELSKAELSASRNETQSAQLAAVAIQESIEQAQVQLAAMDVERSRKEGQLVLLDSQLDLKLSELDAIEKSVEEARTRELALGALCQDADSRIAILADKSECLADHLGKMTADLEKLEQQKLDADETLAKLNAMLLEKSERITSLDSEIVDRESKVASLQREYVLKQEDHAIKHQELTQLEDQIRESESSLESLKAIEMQCDTARHEMNVLLKEIEQLVAQKEEVIDENQRIHASIQLGKAKLNDNEKALQHSINEVLTAESKLTKLNETQCLLQAESHQLSMAVNASKAKIATLAAEMELTNRERQDLIQMTQRLQQECDELSRAKDSLEATQKDIQLRIAADRRDLAECEADVARAADLRQEILALESNVDQINRHSRALTEKVYSLEQECQSKENELDGMGAELKRFDTSVAKSEKMLGELSQKCEIAKSQLVEIEARKASVRKELDQVEQSASKGKLAAETIAQELSVIEMNRKLAQTELQRHSAEVVEAQTVCRQWQEYGEMLKRTNQELDASQKSLEQQVQSLKIEQKNTEYALQQNVIAVKNAASQRDKLVTEIEGLESKRRDLAHSEDALKHSLESKRALLNELDTELDRSRMNIDTTSLEFEQIRLKCKTEKGLLAGLVSQHDELLREISNRSELHEQQSRRCDDLKLQEQSLGMKLAQVKEKIQVFQDQEKMFSEKRVQWEAMDATYSKKSIEIENLQHAIASNREQLKSITKAVSDCQAELGANRNSLDEVVGKLNQSKLQFNRESGRQEAALSNLSSDVQAKQVLLQNTNSALHSANEKLARAETEFANLSARLTEAEFSLSSTESQKASVQKTKEELEASISVLKETRLELESKGSEMRAEVDQIEKQRDVAQAENFEFVQSHLELKATEASLVEGCRFLEGELQLKEQLLIETVSQIGAREQQLVETLQAITVIGQQRENAKARLESDRETLEQTRRELDTLQVQRLDCESSVLHFNSEVARMVASRDRLHEELRLLESKRQSSLKEALSVQSARDARTSNDSEILNEPVVLSVEASLEGEILSELREVSQAIGEQLQVDDVWGDLLRVVRVA